MSNFSNIRIIPLGGLGEIGRNMMVVELDHDIFIIDAGILFPSSDMPGVDFIISDISYLIKNKDRVQAILLTHGHEDHIGALPYVLSELNVPVYASRLTLSNFSECVIQYQIQWVSRSTLLWVQSFTLETLKSIIPP